MSGNIPSIPEFLCGIHSDNQARIYARAPGARAQGNKFSGAAY